jgi:hypothetical protein
MSSSLRVSSSPVSPRPSRGRRAFPAGAGALGAATLLAALVAPGVHPYLQVCWGLLNGITVLVAAGWSVFHPRAVVGRNSGAGGALVHWAVGLTLLAALFLNTLLETVPTLLSEFVPPFTAGVVVFLHLVVLPVAFLLLLGAGLFGAALGAWAAGAAGSAPR